MVGWAPQEHWWSWNSPPQCQELGRLLPRDSISRKKTKSECKVELCLVWPAFPLCLLQVSGREPEIQLCGYGTGTVHSLLCSLGDSFSLSTSFPSLGGGEFGFAHLVRWAFIMQNQYPVGEDSVVGLAMERRIWVYRILVYIIKRNRKISQGNFGGSGGGRLEESCSNFCWLMRGDLTGQRIHGQCCHGHHHQSPLSLCQRASLRFELFGNYLRLLKGAS